MTVQKIRVAIKSPEIVLRDPKNYERITMDGKLVKKNSFWIRRLKAGDCKQLDNPELLDKKQPSLGE